MEDLELIKQAEQALAEIDRTSGLIDEHAGVLAALRLRIHGAPRKSLDDVLKAAGDIKGKKALDDLEEPKQSRTLDDAFRMPEKKKDWPGL